MSELVSDNWICPILQTLMVDPVVAADGHTYERSAMEEWFRTCEEIDVLSPMTGFVLPSRTLFANHALRRTIMEFVEKHPETKNMLTSKEEISKIIAKRRKGNGVEEEEVMLIDLRTDEEIARDEALKHQMQALELEKKDHQPKLAHKTTVYTIEPPTPFLLYNNHTYHGKADELNVYDATQDGKGYVKRDRMEISAKNGGAKCFSLLKSANSIDTRLPDNDIVLTGGRNGNIGMYRYNNHKLTPIMELSGTLQKAHGDAITCIGGWPNFGRAPPLIVTGSRDKSLKVFRGSSYQPDSNNNWSFEYVDTLEKHRDFVQCLSIEVESGLLLSGGADWVAHLWDLGRLDAGCLSEYEAHSYAIRCCSWRSSGDFVLDGYHNSNAHSNIEKVFATGGDDEMVYVFDTRDNRKKVASLACGAAVLTCCWGPSGEAPWFAAGGGTGKDSFNASSGNVEGWVRVWDQRMWKPIGDCCNDSNINNKNKNSSNHLKRHVSSAEGDTDKSRKAHAQVVCGITPIRDINGKVCLASCGGDSAIRIWSLPQGPSVVHNPKLSYTIPVTNTSLESLGLITL